jgi:hypothetical protein
LLVSYSDDIDDPLTNILRAGARQLLAQAVEIEVETFLATVKDLKLARPCRATWLRPGASDCDRHRTGRGVDAGVILPRSAV